MLVTFMVILISIDFLKGLPSQSPATNSLQGEQQFQSSHQTNFEDELRELSNENHTESTKYDVQELNKASSDALSDNVFKSGLPTPKLSFPDVHVRQSSSSFKSKSGECCESESQESDIGNDDQGDLNDINKTPDSSSKILEKSTNLQPFMTTLSPTNHVTPTSFIVQETLLSSSSSAHTQDSSSSSSSSDESLKDTTNTQIPFHDNFSDHENHNADSHRMTTVVPLVLNLKGKEEVDEDMDYPWDTDNDESLEIDIEGSESGSDEALGQQSNSTSLYIQQTNINSKHNYEESILSNDDNTREKINEHIKWTKTDDNGQDDSTSISGSKNIIQMDPTNADVDSENGKLEGDRQSISKNENHEVEKKNTVRVGNKIKASENEEILQLLIKIAEDPEDWQEIRELLEKIQYNETTLRKSKSRLRALARKQRIKFHKNQATDRKKPNGNSERPPPRKTENEILTKSHEKVEQDFKKWTQTGVHKQQSHRLHNPNPKPSNIYKPTSKNPSQIQSDKQRHRHGLWSKNEYGNNNEDFAIETPVTVIGERSWPNPVEKEISEGSASEQLFEIQKEKARLAAISEPNDEMEEQLKALSHLENRLKTHWKQKQKLLQKIRDKDRSLSKQHVRWQSN